MDGADSVYIWNNANQNENCSEQNVIRISGIRRICFNITNLNEENKAKLRGAIRFFNGERNNTAIYIKIGEEIKPCGTIYLTDEILEEFKQICPVTNK